MEKNSFSEIKRIIHFANNENAVQNKYEVFKLRPVMDHLNKNFKSYKIFSKELSIDEQMIKYYGKHCKKQLMKDKPICFGFKQ